jgi:hypothetical protein
LGLKGKTREDTYRDLLSVDNSNGGIDSTLRKVQSGSGVDTPIQVDKNNVRIKPTTADDRGLFEVQDIDSNTLFKVDADNDVISGDLVKDEDTMISDSSSFLCTQQSIKAYIDLNSPGSILKYIALDPTTSTSSTLGILFAEIDTGLRASFSAPISGNVEVEFNIWMDSSSSNKYLYLNLYDYNGSVEVTSTPSGNSEKRFSYADETDDIYITAKWYLTGLTAGTTYYLTPYAKTSMTIKYLRWGGSGSTDYPPAILKITALP